jgi:glyoxylase-like metal-dependent hydrolase (beta-lactamase superfamily II)
MLLFDSDPAKFLSGSPPGFKPEECLIKPVDIKKFRQLAAGDLIDLGNRQLEVWHTPCT